MREAQLPGKEEHVEDEQLPMIVKLFYSILQYLYYSILQL